ncbi:MAG: ABC transporter ATP-binding protein [Deltaproteobacteria bacterium]|nr:ABC transporter ATP-binding protein [Deltaproteobacteria bacterium]
MASANNRRTLRGVLYPYRWRMLVGFAWLMATNAAALWAPRLLNEGVEMLRAGRPWRAVWPHAVLMAAVAVAGAITRVASRISVFNVGRDVEYTLRSDVYRALSRQAPDWFASFPSGDLMTRATSDLSNVRLLFGFTLLNAVNTLVVFAGTLPLLWGLDPVLAVACLVPYPVVFLAARGVSRRVFAQTRENQADLSEVGARVQEFLGGLPVVRAFAAEDHEHARFTAATQKYYASGVRLAVTRNLFGPVMGVLGAASALVALWYGALRVLDGHLTVGGLVEFNTRVALLAWPTLALGWLLAVYQRGRASLERLNDVLSAVPAIRDPEHPVDVAPAGGALRLEGVGVRRGAADDAGARWTLHGVDLDLPARGFVGIVGATGSGKSTLAMLVPRLVDVTAGRVLVDGVDVREQPLMVVRRRVAVASQEAFLFSATVLDNIRFGRPDAGEAEVETLLDAVAMRQDITALPQGIHTVVGEKGITLSGGQRQRVALARALLCAPEILVLDDTVSAVDSETEQRMLAALRSEAGRRTLVVTSHRLSAVKDADEILVLDGGAVVERGKHDALLARNGRYAALWGRERVLEELTRMERDLGGAA